MTSSVICTSCGARIRADRQWCLRCGEELKPTSGRSAGSSSDSSSGSAMSRGSIFMVAAVGSLAVLIGAAMWLQSKSLARDDIARPAVEATASPNRGGPKPQGDSKSATAAASSAAGLSTPMVALDSTRAAAAGSPAGDLQSTKLAYEQALAKKANDPEAQNGLGLVLARLGRLDDAVASFTRAIDLAPGVWAYHFNLAHVEGQREKWNRAVAEYRIAASLLPRDYPTQYNLAMALHKSGNDQAAVPEYERAIQLVPGEPAFHLSLAVSLEKIGRLVDAEREYRQYLRMSPGAPDAERLKAHIQMLHGAPAERPAAADAS
jgi:Flp pilus assembly protein TadD